MNRSPRPHAERDAGSVLPLVLATSFVMGLIVVSVASYVTAALRYSNVVEERADRLAAADGGLRFGIEKLRNFQTLCTTGAGSDDGYTTVFPPLINGAVTEVTCRRVGTPISDVQGWGVVVTGQGVSGSTALLSTQGAGGSNNVKTFSGPVYVADPTRINLQSALRLENGDLWYSRSNCDAAITIPGMGGYLQFVPSSFRGPTCTPKSWDELFREPSIVTVPTSPTNPSYTDTGGCRVFQPGKYTNLPLSTHNYFTAGDYYIENTNIVLQNQTLVGGFPGGAGDSAKVSAPQCAGPQAADQAGGGPGGATLYLGGSSRIEVRNGAVLEIFRRRQVESHVSIHALATSGPGYQASTAGASTWLIETQSGSNNDLAIHGLVWAPRAAVSLGNVANAANGQILGGIVIARLDVQASASASAFAVGIETSPVDVKLLLVSTATKNGESTSVRAVVQFRPDSGELAVNSWRVVN